MATFLFGKDAVLYTGNTALTANTNATSNSISWTAYNNVMDVGMNLGAVKVDVTTRTTAALGWEVEEVVLLNGTLTIQIPVPVTTDATLQSFRAAATGFNTITAMALTQAVNTTGAEGLAANFTVEMSLPQPLKDKQVLEVTLTPTSYPEWVTIS